MRKSKLLLVLEGEDGQVLYLVVEGDIFRSRESPDRRVLKLFLPDAVLVLHIHVFLHQLGDYPRPKDKN